MFDSTIHLGDLLVAAAFLGGGFRMAAKYGQDMRNMKLTIFGSDEPPVEGLVAQVRRLDDKVFGKDR
jgi:hypothetical protein